MPPPALNATLPAGARTDGRQRLSFSRSVVVGRGEGCDLKLDDPRVSRRHAEIYRLGSLWWVRDLGSAGGTFLDGECVDAAPVAGDATLQLGAGGPTIRLEPLDENRIAA